MMMNHELILPTDWDLQDQGMMMVDEDYREDESLFIFSNKQEATQDFVFWQTEGDPSNHSIVDDLMEDILADHEEDEAVVFGRDGALCPPTPPAGRLSLEQELVDTLTAEHDDDDDDSFFTTHSGNSMSDDPLALPCLSPQRQQPQQLFTSFLPLEERYQATLEKLEESMKKSQETRKSLRMKTSKTAEYKRWTSVSGTLSSIEKSTQQLQQYLKSNPTTVL